MPRPTPLPPTDRKPSSPRRFRRSRTTARAAAALLFAGLVAYGVFAYLEAQQVHWHEPRGTIYQGRLRARLLGEQGTPIVLLHGLLGSATYWGAEYDVLANNHRLIVPDLLGFGGSPKPDDGYSPQDHAAAVLGLLDELGIHEKVLLVGHSLGSLVALRVAAQAPERVSAVVGFGVPLYPSEDAARKRVVAMDPMGGLLTLDHPLARRICVWFHSHQRFAGGVVKVLRPGLPMPIARDTMRHTWSSYWGTMSEVILPTNGPEWLGEIALPTRFVVGTDDRVVDLPYLRELTEQHPNVTLRIIEGADHNLPLTDPTLCLEEIARVAGSGSTRG